MSTRYLVVDGHSVIFAWPHLRRLHDHNRAAARKVLADRLQHLHDTTSWRITLVLDGRMGTSAAARKRSAADIVIAYASADQTADSIIERLVGASGVAGQITVVTADEAERVTIESLGAMGASPSWLWREMELEATAFDADLARINRSATWR